MHTYILIISDNENEGIQYHHNPEYMTAVKRGEEVPYNFHMCWTQTRADKLKNFNAVNMWYLNSRCRLALCFFVCFVYFFIFFIFFTKVLILTFYIFKLYIYIYIYKFKNPKVSKK